MKSVLPTLYGILIGVCVVVAFWANEMIWRHADRTFGLPMLVAAISCVLLLGLSHASQCRPVRSNARATKACATNL